MTLIMFLIVGYLINILHTIISVLEKFFVEKVVNTSPREFTTTEPETID